MSTPQTTRLPDTNLFNMSYTTLLCLTARSGTGVFTYRGAVSGRSGYILQADRLSHSPINSFCHKAEKAEILSGGNTHLEKIYPLVLHGGQPDYSITLMFEKSNHVLAEQY